MNYQTDTFIKFRDYLKVHDKKGLVVDIDETLSWTVGYWFDELQKKFGNPEKLTSQELVTKYRYFQNVPYWQTSDILKWTNEAINSNELQELLPLIENANHVVEKINKIIPIVGYMTARPEVILEGTKKWLAKHSFPEAEILLRPNEIPHEHGRIWKARVLEALYPEVLGIIDDNPNLVENLSTTYKGTIFLYDVDEYPRHNIQVIPCKTWDMVYEKITANNPLDSQ
jgi:uncharacterized HAD superfamily protein